MHCPITTSRIKMENAFIAPKSSLMPPCHHPCAPPQPLPTKDLDFVLTVLTFPKNQINVITQYVAF